LALFVLIAAMVHINAIDHYTTTPIMRAVWLVYAILVSGLLMYHKILLPILSWNKTWEVVENREEKQNAAPDRKARLTRPILAAPVSAGRWTLDREQAPLDISRNTSII
jgi:hypothetical protein